VAVYDPYQDSMVDIITFDGISLNPALHLGGVAVDPLTDLVTIVVDAGAAFVTGGKDVTGDNWIIKYDPAAKKVVWRLNITEVTGGRYGGFQDVEHDMRGNTASPPLSTRLARMALTRTSTSSAPTPAPS
jgi:hypothetical protein